MKHQEGMCDCGDWHSLQEWVDLLVDETKEEIKEELDRQEQQDLAHANGDNCAHEKCQECCPHDERDHGICLDCEHEEDPGAAIDRAMSGFEE